MHKKLSPFFIVFNCFLNFFPLLFFLSSLDESKHSIEMPLKEFSIDIKSRISDWVFVYSLDIVAGSCGLRDFFLLMPKSIFAPKTNSLRVTNAHINDTHVTSCTQHSFYFLQIYCYEMNMYDAMLLLVLLFICSHLVPLTFFFEYFSFCFSPIVCM